MDTMRYIKLTDHTNGEIYLAYYTDLEDSKALHFLLCEVNTDEYTVRYSNKPIRTNVRSKLITNMTSRLHSYANGL